MKISSNKKVDLEEENQTKNYWVHLLILLSEDLSIQRDF